MAQGNPENQKSPETESRATEKGNDEYDIDRIRFNALRNALYHTSRRRSYQLLSRLFNFLIILLGTASISGVMANFGISAPMLGAMVAVIGSLQLVFDFGRQASDHQALQRDYYRLLSEIEGRVDPTAGDCARWQGELIRITADEPPVLKAVDAKAYNDAIDATEVYPPTERLVIPRLHRAIGWLVPFEGHYYRKVSEAA